MGNLNELNIDKDMEQIIKNLISEGFDIYVSGKKDKITYFYYTKNNKIAYCEASYYGGFTLTTVHAPNTKTGTGFRVTDHPLGFVSADDAEKAFYPPEWARDMQSIPFANWQAFTKKSRLQYERVTLQG